MMTRSAVTLHTEPPFCAVGRFISRSERVTGEAGSRRRVSVARSHGPAKSAFSRYRQGKLANILKSQYVGYMYLKPRKLSRNEMLLDYSGR